MNKQKTDLKKLAEELVNLSVLEVNELNQILEKDYDIKPSAAPVAVAAAPAAAADSAEEKAEKQQYDVLLKEVGEQKVNVIKTIKDLTEMPLGEAKALVESAPKNIKEGLPKEEATEIKTKLEEIGATVELV